jgi:hypothetical protein
MVAHTCNPSSSGGRDGEDHYLRPARAKIQQDTISTNEKARTCGTHLSSHVLGKHKQEDDSPGQLRHKCETLFKE